MQSLCTALVNIAHQSLSLAIYKQPDCPIHIKEYHESIYNNVNSTHIPTINPRINFNESVEEAFIFYKSVFGGEFSTIMRMKDLTTAEMPVAAEDADKIMHIALPIGGNTLMGNDVPTFMGKVNEQENRSKIAISVENKDEANRLFSGL